MPLIKKISPGRLIVLGFALVIIMGTILLMLPISLNEGVEISFIDALFTSTSAVCVTGLIAVDTADTFNVFGRTVVAMLIQVGGLGVTSVGVGFILLAGKKVSIKGRKLIKEAMNLESMKGLVKIVKAVLLIIFGGLGFLVIKEIFEKRSFKKFCLHTKVVLLMTTLLLVVGTILLKMTENISWLGAFFFSTSARTAGFSTYNLGTFTNAGLFTLVILMFIGASPGSTGGGVKTTTAFIIAKSLYANSTNKHCGAFKRKFPVSVIWKAFNLVILAFLVVIIGTFILCILEPQSSFMQLLFEVTSAFGTVGLSTGITPHLASLSKFIIVLIMFIGRLGPITMATIWYQKKLPEAHYSEESVIIG